VTIQKPPLSSTHTHVSSWRRKALALFPTQVHELARPDATLSKLFVALTGEAADAHVRYFADADDAEAAEALRRVHGFAEWCLHQDALWDAAGIVFYEGLFTITPWEQLPPWLSPFTLGEIRKTYALGLREHGWPKFERLMDGRTEHAYRTTVFATGEIERL
jgi:hypothetical protein